MNIVQNNTGFRHIWTLPEYASKNNTCLRRRDLDGRFDTLETVRRDRIHRRSLDDLEIAKRGKVKTEVLQCIGGLVY
jgi:hypothetical protein